MNDELKDEEIRIRGKKMLTGKRLIFVILAAVLVGAVIAGIYYYENTYKYRQYSVDFHTDLGKTATKIALDTAIAEGYEPNGLIPTTIKAQNLGDYMRLWVILPGNESYSNITLITNHPIKNGETSIFLEEMVSPFEVREKMPWKPGSASWPPRYPTITLQNSTIEVSFEGKMRARIVNPVIMEMSAEQNKKQIDIFNDLANKLGGTNLSYDTNILVLTYEIETKRYESVKVVMDIEGNSTKIVGIIKSESIFDLNSFHFPPYNLKSTSTVSFNKSLNPIISSVLWDFPVKFRCQIFT